MLFVCESKMIFDGDHLIHLLVPQLSIQLERANRPTIWELTETESLDKVMGSGVGDV